MPRLNSFSQRVNKLEYILLFFLASLVFITFLSASSVIGSVCLGVLAILAMFLPRHALFFYACMLPIWNFVGGAVVALSAPYILFFVFFIRLLIAKEKLLAKPYLSFILIILFFALLGTLTSGYYEYLNTTLIFFSVISVSYIYANQILKDEKNIYYVALGFLFSAIVTFMVSFVASDGEFRRLTLGGLSRYDGGNVRQLANVIGVSLVLLPLLYKSLNDSDFFGFSKKTLLYFLTVFLVVGLVLTNSRGVMLAVFISTTSYFILNSEMSFKNIILILLALVGAYFIFNNLISYLSVSDSLSLLEDRFGEEAIEGGFSSRLKIWGAGLSNMSAANYLLGHGFASFRYLALQSGVDYYSHSVFVAVLTDTGLVPFILLMILFSRIALNIKKNKTFVALPIFIYSVISHLSHGSINSTYFWLLLAIAYAISEKKELRLGVGKK